MNRAREKKKLRKFYQEIWIKWHQEQLEKAYWAALLYGIGIKKVKWRKS